MTERSDDLRRLIWDFGHANQAYGEIGTTSGPLVLHKKAGERVDAKFTKMWGEIERLIAERDAALAEVERMRPVVDAARLVVSTHKEIEIDYDDDTREISIVDPYVISYLTRSLDHITTPAPIPSLEESE